jgi:hypothetical protein
MLIGTLLAVVSIFPLALQLQVEADRRMVYQLDRTDVTFCDLEACGILSQFQNLEPVGPAKVTEGEFGTEVLIDVVNHDRLEGKREVWAILRSDQGKIIEGMKIWLELKNAGRNQLCFFFTGTKAEFEKAHLQLGF